MVAKKVDTNYVSSFLIFIFYQEVIKCFLKWLFFVYLMLLKYVKKLRNRCV